MQDTVYIFKLNNTQVQTEEVLIVGIDEEEANTAVENFFTETWAQDTEEKVQVFHDYETYRLSWAKEGEVYWVHPVAASVTPEGIS